MVVMEHMGVRYKDCEIDLERGLLVSEENYSDVSVSSDKKQAAKTPLAKEYGGNGFNSNGVCPENLNLGINKTQDQNGSIDHAVKTRPKDKRKKLSNSKPPKPPRPPRGPSLDAADQKLIKELSEIAMWKRARVERIKALKKMKAAKASSSNRNLYAIVFTILFCVVLIFQGISSRGSSTAGFEGSPLSEGRTQGGLISIQQFFPNPSSNAPNGPGSESPNMVEQVAGADHSMRS